MIKGKEEAHRRREGRRGTKRGRKVGQGDRCKRGLGMIGEDESEVTHRWDSKGEEKEIHCERLVDVMIIRGS